MAGKIGKALGFSMDLGATPKKSGGLPSVDTSAEIGDSDSLAGEEAAPDSAGSPDSSADEHEDKPSAGAEVLAMRMFDRAKSPEDKVSALKAFGEACGWGGY